MRESLRTEHQHGHALSGSGEHATKAGEAADLERLDEGPQQVPDPLRAVQQLDQTHDTEESEEGDGHRRVFIVLHTPKKIKQDLMKRKNTNMLFVMRANVWLTAIFCMGFESCANRERTP